MRTLKEALIKRDKKYKYIENLLKETGLVVIVKGEHGALDAWLYLENEDAKKRISEFSKNESVTFYINQGLDILVTPQLGEIQLWGVYGRKSSDLKEDSTGKFVTLGPWEIIETKYIGGLEKYRTIAEFFQENDLPTPI